jgi:hypothetical protein
VLVYDATACFACGVSISNWEALARDGKVRLVILLSGEPSEDDRRALSLQHVPVTGVLAGTTLPRSRVPSEYLVRNAVIIASAEGQEQIKALRLWKSAF